VTAAAARDAFHVDSLKSLYAAVRVRTFPGAGHAISAQRRTEWPDAIAEFLCHAPVVG
jgi:hypothetical protein